MTINNQVSDADTHGATTGAPVDRRVIPQGLASRNSPGVGLSGRSYRPVWALSSWWCGRVSCGVGSWVRP